CLSDWSSDVCSSDLGLQAFHQGLMHTTVLGKHLSIEAIVKLVRLPEAERELAEQCGSAVDGIGNAFAEIEYFSAARRGGEVHAEIGTASCREGGRMA